MRTNGEWGQREMGVGWGVGFRIPSVCSRGGALFLAGGAGAALKTAAETTCTEKRRMLELEDTLGGS